MDEIAQLEPLYERRVLSLHGEAEAAAPCPACLGERAAPRFLVEGIEAPVVVCEKCGLGRYEPMPSAEEVASFYPEVYYGDSGSKFQWIVEWLVRWAGERYTAFLAQGLEPGARVLDLGCGRGVILGVLADRGFEVHGVEISEDAARGADPRAKIRVAPQLSDAQYPEGFFDQIIVWHVLEHMREPDVTLDEIRRILRPGGRLIVAVPNFSSWQARWAGTSWFHLDPPRHLFHFPMLALRRILARTGFAIETEHHFSLRQNPFGWIQSAMNRHTAWPRNALYTLLQQRALHGEAPFTFGARARLWLGMGLLAPVAMLLSLAEAVMRSGATVHVVARRRGTGPHFEW